jgi:antitoxin component of MazEF toxin-antitoxin module
LVGGVDELEEPVREKVYDLPEMLKGITPEDLPGEVDFGPPCGNEVW